MSQDHAHRPPAIDSISAQCVVLVEGPSDQVAIETLARRRGRDLDAEGVVVVGIGGVTNLRPYMELLGPAGRDLRLAGLGDASEEELFRRGLRRAGIGGLDLTRFGLEELGFFLCVEDLEDELIRALGVEATREIVEDDNTPGSFRSFQNQVAHRHRPVELQLRSFVTNWKITYAGLFVAALDLDRVPRPLDGVLSHV